MKKITEYLKKELLKNIETADREIPNIEEGIKENMDLPNDCLGYVFEDGAVCENKDFKINLLTNLYHQLGYMVCVRSLSRKNLALLEMNDSEFEAYLIKLEEDDRHNAAETAKMRKEIDDWMRSKGYLIRK